MAADRKEYFHRYYRANKEKIRAAERERYWALRGVPRQEKRKILKHRPPPTTKVWRGFSYEEIKLANKLRRQLGCSAKEARRQVVALRVVPRPTP
jgi:hypothetical protein